MFLLTDTCFWSHSYELFAHKILDMNPILSSFRLAFTDAVRDELIHFQLHNFAPIDNIMTVNISDLEFRSISQDYSHFDKADQSLIVAAQKIRRDHPIILTDDGNLLAELLQRDFPAMRLPVFLLLLVKSGIISKNICAKCFRFWEKVGRFQKKAIRLWKKELAQIN